MNAFKSTGLPRRQPIVVAILGVLTCMSASHAIAQDAPTNAAEEETARDATELNAVIVTANKREEDVLTVPSSISVINEEQLDNMHATQLSDLQAYVPGLYINSNGSPGKTAGSLRGVSALSSGATVGTYLDETPLGSSGVYQAANFFTLDLLPYDIARVEVLRGPQGTLYGASTMGGLLKYVTVEPDLNTREFRFGGGLSSVENGDDLGWNGRFGANLPLVTDSVGLRISYAQNDLPGFIDNSIDGDEGINGGKQTSARAALLWKGDAVTLDLTAMRQTIDADNNALVALDPITEKPLYG
ncbi:MAG: TonB-dependent receptor plug domain-containing protein, partial [Rhodanobacteraceae bacterium]